MDLVMRHIELQSWVTIGLAKETTHVRDVAEADGGRSVVLEHLESGPAKFLAVAACTGANVEVSTLARTISGPSSGAGSQ
eukprot:CAMPEP_0194517692 /NCGR_PEP_ID=MMETSP0253-20130528/50939_1 /TAXON_ID=2966 /ORGANISM="Noctiluca scintillans" /LENGTH=79 /DNA_ID=CAMNT_0039361687 /DNA_START=221 /DNA_END=458 /DNA_ORIENTATION=-